MKNYETILPFSCCPLVFSLAKNGGRGGGGGVYNFSLETRLCEDGSPPACSEEQTFTGGRGQNGLLQKQLAPCYCRDKCLMAQP